MKQFIIVFLLLICNKLYSQNTTWHKYYDSNYANIINYKTIINGDIYVFAEIEEYQDARFNDDIIVGIYKIDLNGNPISNISVNLDTISDYNNFKISYISNIDSTFLITGTCRKVSANKIYNYSIIYSSKGNIVSTKIYEYENNNNEYIYLSNLILSNRYLNLYLNNTNSSNIKNYCKVYSDRNNILFEDSIGLLTYDKIQIIDTFINTYKTHINSVNEIELECTKYNFKFDTLSNSKNTTEILTSINSSLKQINNLYYNVGRKQTVLQGQFFGLPNNIFITGQELDNYFIILDSSNTILNKNHFNFTDSTSYSFSSNSSKILQNNNKLYAISDVRVNDSGVKKLLVTKFNNNSKEVFKLREYPLGLTGNNTYTLSILNFHDKIISVLDLKNNLILFDVYDEFLNLTKSWIDTIDVQSVDARAKSIEMINDEIYIFGLGKAIGRNDVDLFIKKISLSTLGITKNKSNQLSSFPNPVNDILYISGVASTSNYTIQIVDIYGNLLISEQNTNELNLQMLSNGIYFLKFIEDNTQLVFKIFKQ